MKRLSGLLCAALLLGACTQDSPTEVGGGLVPPNAIRTFEIVLPPELWLQWDTAFNVYSDVADGDFLLLANGYRGGLDSRALMSFTLPRTITLPDSLDVVRTDSAPIFFAAELRMLADTAASTPRPSIVELYRATESWDRNSADWLNRVDTADVEIPWSQPGGSPGALIGSGTVFVANDTVRVPVDSATLALWADTTNPVRGAVLTAATAGARVRTGLPTLFVQARGALKRELATHLRTRRMKRRSGAHTARGHGRGQIVDAVAISERPAEVEDRAVPGHWEGDLLIGSGGSQIATLVERSTRFVMLVHLPENRKAETVRDAIARKIGQLPKALTRTLTSSGLG